MARSGREPDRLEIWVHGVGGESPDSHLRAAHVRLTVGDDVGGFWEPVDAVGNPIDEQPRREALAWGGATSGTWRNALWVLLLPFALVNVVGWSAARRSPQVADSAGEPTRNRGPRPAALVRAFGLTLTLLVVLLAVTPMFDVVAIQCGTDAHCLASTGWMAPLRWSFFDGEPTRALVAVALVPLAVLFLIDLAARRSARELEGFEPVDLHPTTQDALELSDPDFWWGRHPAARARLLHVSAARAFLAIALAVVIGRFVGSGTAALLVVALLLGYAVLGVAAVLVVDPATYGRAAFGGASADPDDAADPGRRLRRRLLIGVRVGSWVVLLATAIVGLLATPVATSLGGSGRFEEPYQLVTGLAAIQAALGAALLFVKTPPPDGQRPAFGGRAAFVGCVVAAFIVVATGAGVSYQIANVLGDPVFTPVGGDGAIVISWWHETVAVVLVVAVFLAAVVGGVTMLVLRARVVGPQLHEAIDYLRRNGNEPDPTDRLQQARLAKLATSFRWQKLIQDADQGLLLVVRLGVVAALLGVVLHLVDSPSDGPLFGPFTVLSMLVVSLLPIAGFWLLRELLGNRSRRREFARIWDVATFWPRSVHPFAPPPYGERIIPQLRHHLDRLLVDGTDIVLAGHSQGSVVSFAAVLSDPPRVPDDADADWSMLLERAWALNAQRDHLSLVTHGSPLRSLYARIFPAFFNGASFDEAAVRVAGWHNFGARTDLLAEPLFGPWPEQVAACPVCGHPKTRAPRNPRDRVDWLIVDPERWLAPEPPHPPIVGHSTYFTHAGFHAHVDRLGEVAARRRRR